MPERACKPERAHRPEGLDSRDLVEEPDYEGEGAHESEGHGGLQLDQAVDKVEREDQEGHGLDWNLGRRRAFISGREHHAVDAP